MRKVLYGAVVVLLVAYLLTGVVQVRPGERAVVRRFGRVLAYKPAPGLWVGLPWGIDRVDRVEVDRVRNVVLGYQPGDDAGGTIMPPGQLLTGDNNLVNVQVVLNYTVVEEEVEDYVIQQDQVEPLVARAAETVLAEWLGSRTVDEALLNGKAVLPRVLVEQTQERLRPYRLGIRLHNASVVLTPPDQVKDAFDAVTRAQIEIGSSITKAREDAARQERLAEAEKFRIEQQAAAYASEQRRLAAADALAFEKRLAMYRQLRQENPDYLSGIWWDEMGKLFAQLKKNGQIDLLDRHLTPDGLDITVMPLLPRK
ncbi:MAG TPA: SPFH domain-containing protein [Gemmataceae bacterium]|nr:SPFH domain-containing protein [Gemmataceae bacterium]